MESQKFMEMVMEQKVVAITTYKHITIFSGTNSDNVVLRGWLKSLKKDYGKVFELIVAAYSWKGAFYFLWQRDYQTKEAKHFVDDYVIEPYLSIPKIHF